MKLSFSGIHWTNAIVYFAIAIAFFFFNPQSMHSEDLHSLDSIDKPIVEHLRLKVEKKQVKSWIIAEKGSWEKWLAQKEGFLGRNLFWDPLDEEATLLITWKSREIWKNIPQDEIATVQEKFENIARAETGIKQGNPFPLLFEGELLPQ
ncbi:TIGR03792 family protein [Prochlorococcus sp. MIT 1223]|uniref:TIGR03792 family protein n=1 Tax=Prochlorococcus sp. MIT 1223 TaxID=3096217 RepID=UPI002A762208|nr:TIGR03792 family protein [Prochlorococcus sp. MIT 1223]